MASHPSYEQSKEVAEASRETEWTKPSFGKELFLGNFRLDLIHPLPELDAAAVRKGEARRRADRLFTELWDNDDHAQYEAAQQVVSGRYAWFEEDVLDPAGDGPMMPTHGPAAAEHSAASAAPVEATAAG